MPVGMTMLRRALTFLVVVAAGTSGCKPRVNFVEPMVLGGKTIPAHVLNEGYEAYTHYCYACHGEKGDGAGPSAPGMRPPPRDFTQGMFKFAGVSAGELPNDDDLLALVKHGLAGTPMLAWDISDRERNATIQYIKTFSPRWKDEQPGAKVVPDEGDPWKGKEAEALALGRKLYHLSGVEMDKTTGQMKSVLAGCNTCHPSYMARNDIEQLSQSVLGKAAEFREDMYRPSLKPSEYQVGEFKVSILATDFLAQPIKNGSSPEAIFRSIAAGIGGTAMPQWKGAIPDASLWAIAHYIQNLAQMRDTPEGVSLQAKLSADAPDAQ